MLPIIILSLAIVSCLIAMISFAPTAFEHFSLDPLVKIRLIPSPRVVSVRIMVIIYVSDSLNIVLACINIMEASVSHTSIH